MKNIRKFKEKSKYDEYMETSKVYPLLNYIEDIDKARPEKEPVTYFIAKMNYNDASMPNITNRGGIYRSLLVDGVEYITDSASTLLQEETIEITYDVETGNIPSKSIFDVNTEKYIVKLKEPLTENDAMVINLTLTESMIDTFISFVDMISDIVGMTPDLPIDDIKTYIGKNIIIGLPMKEILEFKNKKVKDLIGNLNISSDIIGSLDLGEIGEFKMSSFFNLFYTKLSDTEYQFTNYHTVLAQVLFDVVKILLNMFGSMVGGEMPENIDDMIYNLFQTLGLTIYFVREGGYILDMDINISGTSEENIGQYYFKITDSSKVDTTIIKSTRTFYNPINFKENVEYGEHTIKGIVHDDVTSLHSLINFFSDIKEFYLFSDRYTNATDISCMIGNFGNLSVFDIGQFKTDKVKTIVTSVFDILGLMGGGSNQTLYDINYSNNDLSNVKLMLAPGGANFSSKLTFNQDMSNLKVFFSNINLMGNEQSIGGELDINNEYDNDVLLNGINSAWTLTNEENFNFKVYVNDNTNISSLTVNEVDLIYNEEILAYEGNIKTNNFITSVIKTLNNGVQMVIENVDIRKPLSLNGLEDYDVILTTIDGGRFTNAWSSEWKYSIDGVEVENKETGYTFNDEFEHEIKIKFTDDFINETSQLFEDCSNLTSIRFNDNFDTSKMIGISFYNCSNLTSITFGEKCTFENITNMQSMFYNCSSLTSLDLSLFNTSKVTSMSGMFSGCSGLTSINFGYNFDTSNVTNMNSMFYSCNGLTSITFGYYSDVTKVTSYSNIFYNVPTSCTLTLCDNTVNSWNKIISSYTLNVVESECYIPIECVELTISANNVNGKATSTTISYTAITNGTLYGEEYNGMVITGTVESAPFEQNTDTANTITHEVTFEYMGVTASTTFIQKAWVDQEYSINLNNQWRLSTTVSNPDLSLYDGVYESYNNKGVDYSADICIITIEGYETFTLYVCSNGESCCDYVVVSNLDCTLTSGTTGGTNVKMTTKGNSQNGTAINSYTLVEFTNIDGGLHTIQVMYRKDSSQSSGSDRGYLLIQNNSEKVYNVKLKFIENGLEITEGNIVVNNTTFTFNSEEQVWEGTYVAEQQSYPIYLNGVEVGITNNRKLQYVFIGENNNSYFSITETVSASSTSTSYNLIYNSYVPYIDAMIIDGEQVEISSTKTFSSVGEHTVQMMIDTSNLTSMSYMFSGCTTLTSIEFNDSFDTSNITNMNQMFVKCNGLTSLDLSSFDTSAVTDMSYMFYNCNKLTSLDLSSFDTSAVTDMSYMFYYCYNLTSLNLSNFDTSKVTNMEYMFEYCYKLTSLDLSSFDTSNVTTMNRMFYYCSGLTSLNLSSFNTSNVTDMISMFSRCHSLTSLDLSNFDTSKVTNMTSMFNSCSGLTELTIMGNVSKVTSYSSMFSGITSSGTLTYNCAYSDTWNNLLVTNSGSTYFPSGWTITCKPSEITIKLKLIENGLEITEGDIVINETNAIYNIENNYWECTYVAEQQKYDISLNGEIIGKTNYEKLQYVFIGENNNSYFSITETVSASSTSTSYGLINSSYVKYIDAMIIDDVQITPCSSYNFNSVGEHTIKIIMDTSKVTSMYQMFNSCRGLKSLDLSNFDTSNVISMTYMFMDCSGLTSLDLSNFNTSAVTDMSYMFSSCRSLTSLDLSSFDTSKVTNMTSMFSGCTNLISMDLSNFNTSNVTYMGYMFMGCNSLISLDLSSFDTYNVTNMTSMFSGCTNLISMDLSNFNMGNLSYGCDYIFRDCNNIETIKFGYNTNNTRLHYTFYNCTKLSSITFYDDYIFSANVFYNVATEGTLYKSMNIDDISKPSNWKIETFPYYVTKNIIIVKDSSYLEDGIITIGDVETTQTYDTETHQYSVTFMSDGSEYPIIIDGVETEYKVSYKTEERIFILLGDNSEITSTLDFTSEESCNEILSNNDIVPSNEYNWLFDSSVNGLSYENKMSLGNKPSNINIKLNGDIVIVTYGLSCEMYDGIKVSYGDKKSVIITDTNETFKQIVNIDENKTFKFSYFNDFITSLKDDKCWIKKIDVIKLP